MTHDTQDTPLSPEWLKEYRKLGETGRRLGWRLQLSGRELLALLDAYEARSKPVAQTSVERVEAFFALPVEQRSKENLARLLDEVREEQKERDAKILDDYRQRSGSSMQPKRDMQTMWVALEHCAAAIRSQGDGT